MLGSKHSLIVLVCALGCDDPEPAALDAAPAPADAAQTRADAARPPADVDAAPASPCTGELCQPSDARDVAVERADAQAALPIPDASVDASTAVQPALPTLSVTGETCLGLAYLDVGCEPERCGPAHYSYVNLNVDPANITCPGGEGSCPEPLTDPQDPFYLNSRIDRGYAVVASEDPRVGGLIGFKVDIEFARNAEEAQKAVTFANLYLDLGWQNALWSEPRPGTDSAPRDMHVEVLSFENRRIHIRAHDTAVWFNSGHIPGFELCGGLEGACVGDGCWYTNTANHGSGEAPTIDMDLEFTIPPAEKVLWPPAP